MTTPLEPLLRASLPLARARGSLRALIEHVETDMAERESAGDTDEVLAWIVSELRRLQAELDQYVALVRRVGV